MVSKERSEVLNITMLNDKNNALDYFFASLVKFTALSSGSRIRIIHQLEVLDEVGDCVLALLVRLLEIGEHVSDLLHRYRLNLQVDKH